MGRLPQLDALLEYGGFVIAAVIVIWFCRRYNRRKK